MTLTAAGLLHWKRSPRNRRAPIPLLPSRDRFSSASRSVRFRIEIGPVPHRDRFSSGSRPVRLRLGLLRRREQEAVGGNAVRGSPATDPDPVPPESGRTHRPAAALRAKPPTEPPRSAASPPRPRARGGPREQPHAPRPKSTPAGRNTPSLFPQAPRELPPRQETRLSANRTRCRTRPISANR